MYCKECGVTVFEKYYISQTGFFFCEACWSKISIKTTSKPFSPPELLSLPKFEIVKPMLPSGHSFSMTQYVDYLSLSDLYDPNRPPRQMVFDLEQYPQRTGVIKNPETGELEPAFISYKLAYKASLPPSTVHLKKVKKPEPEKFPTEVKLYNATPMGFTPWGLP